MNNKLSPILLQRFHNLTEAGLIKVIEDEDGFPVLAPTITEHAFPADAADPTASAVPADPVAPATPAEQDTVLLLLAVLDKEPRTPDRLHYLREASREIRLRSVLSLIL